jgi:hypothetical protein
MLVEFFDHYLKGVANGIGREPAARGEIPAESPPAKK